MVPRSRDRAGHERQAQVRRVILESPFAGNVERNLRYLRSCMRDCVLRGESPYASHGLLTQPGVLDDDKPDERELGIRAGFAWREVAEATIVYENLGRSKGMQYGIDDAIRSSRPIEYRMLPSSWEGPHECGHARGHEIDDCPCCGL